MLGDKSHEVLVFLFFLGVSFCFWLLQTLNETFETEITIPLQLKKVPENVLITYELPSQINVTVREKGTSLLRYFRHNLKTPLAVDFDRYDNGNVTGRVQVPLTDIQRLVVNQLGETSHVLAIHPDTLEFCYNRGQSARLPVKVRGLISASPQSYLQGMDLTVDSVLVYAPASVLDTMRYAYTQVVDMQNLSRNSSTTVSFCKMKGVKYEPERVEVTAQVGYYTEKTVEVPIIGLNFPGDKELRTFPSKAKIVFRVGSGMFQRINASNFVLAITYEELLQNEDSKFRLHLKSLPDGVSNVRIIPEEVDYLIEQVDQEEAER